MTVAGSESTHWKQMLRRQFVHGLTIADIHSPSDFREWFRLLELRQWPNLALVVRVRPSRHSRSATELAFFVSDRLKSALRTELLQQLLVVWPALLGNWQDDLELVVLLHLPHLITKNAITEAILPVLENVSLPLTSDVYAGVSRNTENISLLSAAIRATRHAAYQAQQQHRLLLHVDDMEVFKTDVFKTEEFRADGVQAEGFEAKGLPLVGLELPRDESIARGFLTDTTLENPLESQIRQMKDVLLAHRRPNRMPLEHAKRQILEKLVGLMNTCRGAGVAIDGEELIDNKLFEGLIKAASVSKLVLWVEQSGLLFIDKLSRLADQSKSRIIEQAISFLTAHLQEDLSLEAVAMHCNVSHYYLSHLFRKETGTTVTAFIKKARIDQAMVLLRDANLTIAEVAYKVGYQDPNYFSKSFRSYVGVSPTEFRNL